MSESYLLKGAHVVNPAETYEADVRVSNGVIQAIGLGLREQRGDRVLDCSGLVLSPGLINAHDHLQFNLYSRIGTPPYANAYEWGKDILTNFRHVVDPIERIPLRQRLLWGACKNLFSGITYVVHHDPLSLQFRWRFPIGVLRRFTFAHSIGNEPALRERLKERQPNVPFIIHLAEGTDERSGKEVQTLNQLGGLDERTVAVHAIKINDDDIATLAAANSAVVWCPASNLFLFGVSAPVVKLMGRVPVALGTDSTLTGSISLFDEMRCARNQTTFTSQQVFQMVTENPRRIFHLPTHAGHLAENQPADLFLVPSRESDPYQSVVSAEPEHIMLLMRNGRLVFYDAARFGYSLGSRGDCIFLGARRKQILDGRCLSLYTILKPYLAHYDYLHEN